MKYGKLRITWTAFWGIAAELLICLWVRSYWRMDSASRISPHGYFVGVVSMSGGAQLQGLPFNGWTPGCHLHSEPNSIQGHGSQFIWTMSMSMFVVRAPYWLFLMIASLGIAAPWLDFRFSLRTLLIATTLIAAVLGSIIVLSR